MQIICRLVLVFLFGIGLSTKSFATEIGVNSNPMDLTCAQIQAMGLKTWNRRQRAHWDRQGFAVDQSHYQGSDFTNVMGKRIDNPKGVAMVLHGLNQRPQTMQPMVDYFNSRGVIALKVSMPGHRGSYAEAKQVEPVDYLREAYFAYCFARQMADEFGVPLFGSGISQGGMMLERIVNAEFPDEVVFDGRILKAPAIRLPGYLFSSSKLLVGGLQSLGLALPAHIMPGEIRANSFIPVALGRALIENIKALNKSGFTRSDQNTLVLMDCQDVLVSFGGVSGLADKMKNWQVLMVRTKDAEMMGAFMHHLVMGREGLGEAMWMGAQARMDSVLGIKPTVK